MIKDKILIVVALLYMAAGISGCGKKDEKLLGPKITFANDIEETTAKSYNIDVTITSSDGLVKVTVEKVFLSNEENEVIEEVTEFSDPKKYTFQSVISATKWTIIRFSATDKKGITTISSFTFIITD